MINPMANVYQPATAPTLYFIGVTTGQSSIMKVFPKWADALGLKDAVIKGIDFAPHSSAEEYREAVTFIKNDPLSLGALVTTHKIDLFNTCKDLFEYVDPVSYTHLKSLLAIALTAATLEQRTGAPSDTIKAAPFPIDSVARVVTNPCILP